MLMMMSYDIYNLSQAGAGRTRPVRARSGEAAGDGDREKREERLAKIAGGFFMRCSLRRRFRCMAEDAERQ